MLCKTIISRKRSLCPGHSFAVWHESHVSTEVGSRAPTLRQISDVWVRLHQGKVYAHGCDSPHWIKDKERHRNRVKGLEEEWRMLKAGVVMLQRANHLGFVLSVTLCNVQSRMWVNYSHVEMKNISKLTNDLFLWCPCRKTPKWGFKAFCRSCVVKTVNWRSSRRTTRTKFWYLESMWKVSDVLC